MQKFFNIVRGPKAKKIFRIFVPISLFVFIFYGSTIAFYSIKHNIPPERAAYWVRDDLKDLTYKLSVNIGSSLRSLAANVSGIFEDEVLAGTEEGRYFEYIQLPSISNFSNSEFLGSANISYPIKTLPGPGGITPSVSLNYSSGSVDELIDKTNEKRWFRRQSGPAGLGWGIGGEYSISIDTHGQAFPRFSNDYSGQWRDTCRWTYHISFPGGSSELIKVDSNGLKINRCVWDGSIDQWNKNPAWENGQWRTDPEIFVNVVEAPSGIHTVGGRWVIKTSDNSTYVFGEDSQSKYAFKDGATRVTSLVWWNCMQSDPNKPAHQSCIQFGNFIQPIGWKLYTMTNPFGQSIRYDYQPFTGNLGGPSTIAETYVGRSEMREISYGDNKIKFYYDKAREDWRIVTEDGKFVYDDRNNLGSNDDAYASITDKALSKIEVIKSGNVVGRYDLTYYDTFEKKPDGTKEDGADIYGLYKVNNGIESFNLLLKSIKYAGKDGTSSLPPNVYTYKQVPFYLNDDTKTGEVDTLYTNARNSLYIDTANNGYGGSVQYFYDETQQVIKRCSERGSACGDTNDNQRAKLLKTRTSDGMGEYWDTVFQYPSTAPESLYIENDGVSSGNPDGHPEGKYYAFLGYPWVKSMVFEKNVSVDAKNPSQTPLASSKNFFYTTVTSSTCRRPDPRGGLSYKSWQTDKGGKVYSETLNNYSFSTENSCAHVVSNDYQKNTQFLPWKVTLLTEIRSADIGIGNASVLSDSQTLYDNKCTNTTCARTRVENKYAYNLAASPLHNIQAKNFGALTESTNHGDVSRTGDEVKTVTKYAHNTSAGNWILNLPYESYSVDPTNTGRIFNHSFMYYDYRDTEENAAYKINTKGLPTSVRILEGDSGESFRTYTKFDNYGNVTQTIDAKGNSSFTTYDLSHIYPIEVKNALGYTVKTSYDTELGVPLSVTDANNITTNFRYDALGRLKKVINPGDSEASPSVEYNYTINEKVPDTASTWTRIATYSNIGCGWTKNLNLTASAFRITMTGGGGADGQISFYSVQDAGLDCRTHGSDGVKFNGDIASYYVKPNNVCALRVGEVRTTDIFPSQRFTSANFKVGCPDGEVMTADVDYLKPTQPVNTSLPSLIVHTKTKASDGNYLESYDFFNGIGQKYETQSKQPSGAALTAVSHTDSLGRAVYSYNPFEHGSFGTSVKNAPTGTAFSQSTYDVKGRVTQVKLPDGTTTKSLYDEAGFRVAAIDQEGKVVVSANKGPGRISKTLNCKDKTGTWCTESGALVTQVESDLLGNTLKVTDSEGVTLTTNVFDTIGRRKESTDVDLGKWTYTYDKNGNLDTQTSPRGDVVKFNYDKLSRITTQLFNGQEKVRYAYDSATNGIGKKASYEDSYQKTTYSYDERGRLRSVSKDFSKGELSDLYTDNPYTFSYDYDKLDRTTAITYPEVAGEASETVTFGFNGPYLNSVTGTDPYVRSTKYNIFGSVTERTLGNGVVESYAFDTVLNRLENIDYQNSSGSFVDLSYDYYPAGNISSITDSVNSNDPSLGMTQSFTYDNYYRLTGVSDGAYTANFEYDDLNRMLSKNYDGTGTSFNYNSNFPYHGIKTVSDSSVSNSPITYDEQGNILSYSIGGLDRTIDWDYSSGKPETVVVNRDDGTTDTVTYYYDGEGNRIVKKVDGGNYTAYVNGYLQKVVADYKTTWKRNYMAGGKIIAIRDIEGGAVPTPTVSVDNTPTPVPTYAAGDFDKDGDVDLLDYNAFLGFNNFGSQGTPGFSPADLVEDGLIDIFDFNLLITNYTGP